jgi:hypothetical protein
MPRRKHVGTGDLALVRRINLALLRQLLRTHGATSRAALAQATGLYKSTMSNLVVEPRTRQRVAELRVQSSGAGRPGTLLMINPIERASLMNALNPTRVVLGGVLSHAPDLLLRVIAQEIKQRTLRWNRATVQVVRAAHGSDACVRGGVATVYPYVLAQPDPINERNGGEPR